MNYIKNKAQNPKELLRLFILISLIGFMIITGITAYGIFSISRNSNIAEAEHDSIIIGNTLLEHEAEKFTALLSLSNQDNNSIQTTIPQTEVYSIQAGTFSYKSGALQKYDEFSDKLSNLPEKYSIRVEKIGKYFTIRIGEFPNKLKAKEASKHLSTFISESVVIKSVIKKERLIKSNVNIDKNIQTEVELDYKSTDIYKNIDRHIRSLLTTTNIVMIKIFSLDSIIIYSTDPTIINKNDSKNPRLQDALAGNVNSLFKRKDQITGVEGDKKIDLDVVETYFPMKNANDKIIGVYEVYMDITRYRIDVKDRLFKSVTFIAILLIVVIGVFITLMRTGMQELGRVQEKLVEYSSTDSLTGLFNRRHLFKQLEKEFKLLQNPERRKEDTNSIGCIMADIDHFKMFNDQYGHQTGDMVLQFVSKQILETLRPYDIAGRYGGEEFLIMLPNSEIHETQKAAERIWSNIRTAELDTIEGKFSVTLSIGFSCLTEKDKSIEDAINRADENLYKAKESGRDRVCWGEGCVIREKLTI